MRKYHAPSCSGEMLFDPLPLQIPEDTLWNQQTLHQAIGETIRRQARSELLARDAIIGPGSLGNPQGIWLFGGHQPEIFHPGVWLKNFYLAGLAKRLGGLAVNLVVDTDTVKQPSLKIPFRGDSPKWTQIAELPLGVSETESIWAKVPLPSREMIKKWLERAEPLLGNWSWTPIMVDLWAQQPWLELYDLSQNNLGIYHVQLRRYFEKDWGIQTIEFPVSQLSQTPSFRKFAQDIVDELPRFVTIYNQAILNYRERRKLRSRTHPATLLITKDDQFETPFWQGTPQAPYRSRWFAKPRDPLPEVLYPRAFTLTLFVRLYLADLFLHGLGGGLYDEVTDEIISEFYRIPPPRYAVATGTLRLPWEPFPRPAKSRAQLLADLRKLDWNPEEWTQSPLSQQKWLLREQAQKSSSDLKTIARKIRRLNAELSLGLQELRKQKLRELADFEQWSYANQILQNREYGWLLHPRDCLHAFCDKAFQQGMCAG